MILPPDTTTFTCVVPNRVVSASPLNVPSFALLELLDPDEDEEGVVDGSAAGVDAPEVSSRDADALVTAEGGRGLKRSTPAVPRTVAVRTIGARRMRIS
ncbi:hypothetical protein GCM10009869_31990 [Amnibacterium kyonggiense]